MEQDQILDQESSLNNVTLGSSQKRLEWYRYRYQTEVPVSNWGTGIKLRYRYQTEVPVSNWGTGIKLRYRYQTEVPEPV